MRKNKQKRRKKENYIKEIIVWLPIFIISLFFIFIAAQDWMILKNWDDGEILEYQGSYTFYQKVGHRGISYIFELDNGDTVSIGSHAIIQDDVDFESFEELTFRYTARKEILRFGKHTGVSITTTDNGFVLQQEEASKRELRGFAILWSVFAIIFSSFIIVPLSFDIYISILHHSWKRQKIRKKQKVINNKEYL